jgi:DNA polymerase-3 subunit delta'
VLAGSHPDVRVVVPEGLSIKVSETREVVQASARLPALGRWQVVIIEDSDRLGERAFNALLKAVEEPSPRTVFLLCSPSAHPDDIAVTIRSRCRLIGLRTPPAAAVAEVLVRDGVDEHTAAWAAAAGQGHVGRSRRLARDDAARAHRAEVLAIPASLTSLGACMRAAEQLIAAADAEKSALADELDAGETEALQTALGAGGTGKGTAASGRSANAALKELAKRQKDRGTRTLRDTLDRALVDLAGFYRDALLVHAGSDAQRAHPDFDDDVRAVALRVPATGVLQRLDAVLACREALEQNVKPQIAVEAMTAALRLPA